MSTYWYFECPEHDPPLRSPDEFTQHTDDEHYRAGIRLAIARPLADDFSKDDDYFQRNARNFLYHHPRCQLLVISENGARRSFEIEVKTLQNEQMLILRAEIAALQGELETAVDLLEKLRRTTP